MEAKTKNTKLNDDDLFTIVGADYQIHTPVLKKPNLWYRLKGKPKCFSYHSGSNHWRVHFCRTDYES